MAKCYTGNSRDFLCGVMTQFFDSFWAVPKFKHTAMIHIASCAVYLFIFLICWWGQTISISEAFSCTATQPISSLTVQCSVFVDNTQTHLPKKKGKKVVLSSDVVWWQYSFNMDKRCSSSIHKKFLCWSDSYHCPC